MSFVNLHVHTGYSLLDGMIRINELAARVSELGQTACAITDHGTLAGAVKFTDACIKKGVKPILGSEFYVTDDRFDNRPETRSGRHLILLAKNDIGWKNLVKLSTLSYTEGYYYKPRIDHALLRQYSEGLICSSACIGGDIAAHLAGGFEGDAKLPYDPELAKAKALWYVSIFGEDMYFEMQSYGSEQQERVNEFYRSNFPASQLIASSDCHYLLSQEAEAHDTMLCCNTASRKDQQDRFAFVSDQFFLKTENEMLENFSLAEVQNTQTLADKVTFELQLRKTFYMPELPAEIVENGAEWKFRKECMKGLALRVGLAHPDSYTPEEPEKIRAALTRMGIPEYADRLEYEMDVFVQARFVEYVLLLWDLMAWCKTENIFTGPGRGSGAGSLVLYSLNITQVDPIERDCPFERFINPGRIQNFAPPDVDLDFPQSRREDVVGYLRQRYGSEHVVQIATYASMGPSAMLRSFAKVFSLSFEDLEKLLSAIPDGETSIQGRGAAGDIGSSMTLEGAYEQSETFRECIDSLGAVGEQILEHGRKIQNLGSHVSTHASGILISSVPIESLVPLASVKDDSAPSGRRTVAQFDMFDAEAIGLIKFDILGLKVLDTLAYVEEQIRLHDHPSFSFSNVDLDDPVPYRLLELGRTVGVFQAEGQGFGRYLSAVKPQNVEDLTALTSLCRPGPTICGLTETYVQRRQGKLPVTYTIPELEPILSRTLGVMCFQEDIMSIAQQLAGYSSSEADDLRKIMGKKQRDKMPAQKEKFLDGLEAYSGVERFVGEALWDEIASMAEYVFNRSHAVAYSFITAMCLWAKAYYPSYFIAASMTSEAKGDKAEMPALLQDSRFLEVDVVVPDINESHLYFHATDHKTVRIGLLGVKGVGIKAVETILNDRAANGPFKSREDFNKRVPARSCNKKVREALYEAGAFDALEEHVRLVTVESAKKELDLFGFFLNKHMCELLRDVWRQQGDNIHTLRQIFESREQAVKVSRRGKQVSRSVEFAEYPTRVVVMKSTSKQSKKNGKVNHFIQVSDETGSADLVIPQQMMFRFGITSISKGTVLDMIGRRSSTDESSRDFRASLVRVV